ncbi:hypothetical protein [Leptospira noguchii]|uniref:hypothetical protein n=1 Tax=Leptospira noguchii TaxID=28182 RepID=UPI000A6FFAF8|nr:hypothetical protein [Leptospira noguchii]
MRIKKSIIFLITLATGIGDIFAQNVDITNPILKDKDFEMFFRITKNTVDFATVKNALLTQNSLVFNRSLGGINLFFVPKMGNFKGKGFEWGMGIQHGFYKSNISASFAKLKSNNLQDSKLTNTSLAIEINSIRNQLDKLK